MCGIVGALGNNKACNKSIEEMANTLKHRGPDDFGIWSDTNNNIFLAHRRLSILDLSNNGHQPMISESERYIVVFNGEIYNHMDLREKYFKGYRWKSTSDTETLLASFDKWGIEKTLELLEGMFAFAVWDSHERSLNLVRDRFGEKPLFYYRGEQGIIFASELKAIESLLDSKPEIDTDSLSIFLSLSYIPSPLSIYKNIFKLDSGHIIKFHIDDYQVSKTYWSLEDKYSYARQNIFERGDNDAINILENLLKNTLKNQSISDVPLGTFLSGGIDSTLITSLLQSMSIEPVKTFTIGFDKKEFDESYYAKNIASYLGTDHNELFVTSEDALNIIPFLQDIYDEPFADSSQIPTFLISKLAKKDVTVALSGDGADELFGGYNRYIFAEKIWRLLNKFPLSIRKKSSNFLSFLPNNLVSTFLNTSNSFLPNKIKFAYPMTKYLKICDLLTSESDQELYHRLITFWSFNPPVKTKKEFDIRKYLKDSFTCSSNYSFLENMMISDLRYYLTDNILQKVDRASMANSLETRAPFLDHKIAEFSFSLPIDMKLRNGESKWILKQILKRYVPKNLFERKKMGFSIPIDNWLRGSLKNWAGDLMSEENLSKVDFLDAKSINNAWSAHLKGKGNFQYPLWNILMFLSWYDK